MIACVGPLGPMLFGTHFGTAHRPPGYVASGMGASIAGPILQRLTSGRHLSLHEAAFVASYAIFLAKRSSQGVGKATQISALAPSGFRYLLPDRQAEIDECVRRHVDELEPLMVRAVLGHDQGDIERSIDAIRTALAEALSGPVWQAPRPSPQASPVPQASTDGPLGPPPSPESPGASDGS